MIKSVIKYLCSAKYGALKQAITPFLYTNKKTTESRINQNNNAFIKIMRK